MIPGGPQVNPISIYQSIFLKESYTIVFRPLQQGIGKP